MESQLAYCSACDLQVPIAITPGPVHGGQANINDAPEVVCLHFGQHCTGEFCPMFGLPRILMGVRLARSEHEPEGGWKTITAFCDGCGHVSEQQVLDTNHAHCAECGSVNRYVILKMDDGNYVAAGPRPIAPQ
jgi:hypothetical protein